MLSEQSMCRLCAKQMSVRDPTTFPFSPIPCLRKKTAHRQPARTLLIFLFSTPCGEPSEHRTGKSSSGRLLEPHGQQLGANGAPNRWVRVTPAFGPPDRYSNRRISTGSSPTAARAGRIVAATEIPIATAVIHSPSKRLEYRGGDGNFRRGHDSTRA